MTDAPLAKPARQNPLREFLAILTLSLAVLSVYWSPKPPGMSLLANDYTMLHQFRMRFARQILFHEHRLPAWYPTELLGTPFWSNVQNFPFIPTRLLLLMLDPAGPYTYTLAINLAAILSALFTYLFCRRIGLGMIAAAAAGWTFACSGFFASRVGAGHLPLLEAYGALPLLLWLIEGLLQARQKARWIAALALSSAAVLLAGHPQLPVYALATAALYGMWRGGWRDGRRTLAAMVIGGGCAAFALLPMALLVGRSTRVLPLEEASNSLAMPYERLAGFFLPWLDGASPGMVRAKTNPFHGYPSLAHFWDTFVYAGWLPWIAAAALSQLFLFPRLRPRWNKISLFLLAMGIAGLLLSTPLAQHVAAFLPGTLLRSPARLLYLTEFALAMALGALIEILMRGSPARWTPWVVPLLLIAHGLDLGATDREFLPHAPQNLDQESRAIAATLQDIGPGRVAMDINMPTDVNRMVDDVGFFDSIMLAKPYRWMMDLSGARPDVNVQKVDGSELPSRTLEAAGVRFVFTTRNRPDLRRVGGTDLIRIYATRHPDQRAAFFPANHLQFLDPKTIHDRLRDPAFDPHNTLLLPSGSEVPAATADEPASAAAIDYRRPDSDHIECTVQTSQPGYLRVIESWDQGWSATIDGKAVTIAPAMDAMLAVPVTAGKHDVTFEYHTPGAQIGLAISVISLMVLAGWALFAGLKK